MTGNIAYLSDFKEFDKGYVTFGRGAHGGRISGKGTLKTDSLDFEDVGDKAVHKELGDRMERATTTTSSLEAEQESGNINKSKSMATLNGSRKKKSRTTGLKRLRKVGESRRVESSKDKDSLGAQEDASKQGRSFEDIDKDAEVSLVDET
ncbi:hypothetical protein Tco_0688733 [Tanacetum coccineum]